jgi:hypothetical protein
MCHNEGMCFSATASFIAAGSLGAAGAATLRQAKSKARVPFAAIPLLFGVQQALEGVVWVSAGIPWLQGAAAYAYVMFSHVVWPFYVPFAVMSLEKPGRRKSILKGFVVFGSALSLWLFSYIVTGPVSAKLNGHGIIYSMTEPRIPYGLAAYVFVTVFSCFFSSHKFVRVFGISLLGSLGIAIYAYQETFYSVWCFFAAILSFIIYVHLTTTRADIKEFIAKAGDSLSQRFPKNSPRAD